MKLLVISYKTCWPDAASLRRGYAATDGGFPFQIALAELFDETRLLIPCELRERGSGRRAAGESSVGGSATGAQGADLRRKPAVPFWLLRSSAVALL